MAENKFKDTILKILKSTAKLINKIYWRITIWEHTLKLGFLFISPSVRYNCISKLHAAAEVGEDITPAIPLIHPLLKDERPYIIRCAVEALYYAVRNKTDISRAVPALKKALEDEYLDYDVKRIGDEILGQYVPWKFELNIRKMIKKGDYTSALTEIKNAAHDMRISPKNTPRNNKRRREFFYVLSKLTTDIRDIMNPDKKSFHKPVKRQEIRRTHLRRVANG